MKKPFSTYLGFIKQSKIFLIAFGALYLVGIILGVFFSPIAQKFVLGESVVNFYFNALSKNGRIFSLIFSVVLSDVFFLLLFYLCSFTVYTVAIDLALVLYRGYIVAGVSFLFIKIFGISGAFLYVLCVLIHNVIVTLSLSAFASIMAKLLKSRAKKAKDMRNDLIIVSTAAALSAIIIEIFLLVFVLRPLNSTF